MAPFINALDSNRLQAAEKSDPLKREAEKKKTQDFFFCKEAKNGNSFPEAFAGLKTFSEKSLQLFSLCTYIRFCIFSLHDVFCNMRHFVLKHRLKFKSNAVVEKLRICHCPGQSPVSRGSSTAAGNACWLFCKTHSSARTQTHFSASP